MLVAHPQLEPTCVQSYSQTIPLLPLVKQKVTTLPLHVC